ncbi:MAG: LpxL/LpxP family acyltransferase [Promethearchaeota archaeon]
MASASAQKTISNGLSKDSKMKPTEDFPDNSPVFRLTHFIHRYRLHRHFTHIPFTGFQMISTAMHKIFTKASRGQIEKTWRRLIPPKFLSKRNLDLWTDAFIKFNIELYLDTTFYLPIRSPENIEYFTPVIGLDNIQRALQKGKGAFLTTVHFGEFNHSYFNLLHQHFTLNGKPQKFYIAALSSAENEFLFRAMAESIPNFEVILTGSFRELKAKIEKRLAQNSVVMVMQDYFHPAQYRVPFIYGKERYNFLVPCPQMLSYFHLKQGTPVIPAICLPGKNLKHSTVKFLPEISLQTCNLEDYHPKLQQDLIKYRKGELPYTKHFGLLSTIINAQLYPNIMTHPYLWQASYLFFERTQFRIVLKNVTHLGTLFRISAEQLLNFMEKSYEPGREDEQIVPLLEEWHKFATKCEREGNAVGTCQIQNKHIEIGRLNSAAAFRKVNHIIRSHQSSAFRQQYPEFDKLLDKILDCI